MKLIHVGASFHIPIEAMNVSCAQVLCIRGLPCIRYHARHCHLRLAASISSFNAFWSSSQQSVYQGFGSINCTSDSEISKSGKSSQLQFSSSVNELGYRRVIDAVAGPYRQKSVTRLYGRLQPAFTRFQLESSQPSHTGPQRLGVMVTLVTESDSSSSLRRENARLPLLAVGSKQMSENTCCANKSAKCLHVRRRAFMSDFTSEQHKLKISSGKSKRNIVW